MNRRDALFATGALLAAGAASAAADHSHHHAGPHPWQAVLDTAGICIEKGEVCLTHCIMLMGEGDKTMAACASSVREMLATCRALITLAGAESKFAPKLAALCVDVCKACEAECKKHADKHKACK
ncbi:MAG TPA: Csp1 family four helix bundle copper storage protein, partial [Zoogloea sp.]|nr:Csp1 family four helix bundle copper storage protein [Zoogloea sp.]